MKPNYYIAVIADGGGATQRCRQHRGFVVRRLCDAVRTSCSMANLRMTGESLSSMPALQTYTQRANELTYT